jgi:anti-sigma B factor antagonist
MADKPQFHVKLEKPGDEIAVIELAGGVDIYSAPRFKEVLLQGIDDGARQVIVDLTNVTFIDSTGLGVLVSGAKRVRSQGVSFAIVSSTQSIMSIFEITGLDRLYSIYATRKEALRAATGQAAADDEAGPNEAAAPGSLA